jgi:hypothetical protein
MMRLTTTLAMTGLLVGSAFAVTSAEALAKSRHDASTSTRARSAAQRGSA